MDLMGRRILLRNLSETDLRVEFVESYERIQPLVVMAP